MTLILVLLLLVFVIIYDFASQIFFGILLVIGAILFFILGYLPAKLWDWVMENKKLSVIAFCVGAFAAYIANMLSDWIAA